MHNLGGVYHIAIAGAGRVGQSLGRLLSGLGHGIGAVSCRTLEAAARAVCFIGAGEPVAHADFPRLTTPAERTVLFVTTPDDVITTMAERLAGRSPAWQGITVLHCSGALSSTALSALQQIGAHVGSMHPLYAFGSVTSNQRDLYGVHWTIEGDVASKRVARQLVAQLGGHLHEIEPEHKVLYHAAASLAGNHLTALLSLCITLLRHCGIAPDQARSMLIPLSEGVLQRLKAEGEVAALSGPISRGDAGIVAQHLDALQDFPPVYHQVYRSLGSELVTLARHKGVSAAALADISQLLQH